MKLDEHVPVHVLEPKHPEYHASSDDDTQVVDDDEDPEEDPSEKHEPEDDDEDLEENPNEEHKPKDSNKTKLFEENKTAVTPPPPRHRGTIARAANRAEDVGYVRALQASERRMMASIKEVNLRVSYQAQVRRQESIYIHNFMMLRLTAETLDLRLMVKGNDVAAYTQRFQELALMCTKFLADETEKVDKYISGLPNNIHENVMSARPKSLDETIELANDLMDQKLRTYAERQNENNRKADDSSRNNQQQSHKKQNVARAYTTGPGEKQVNTWDLPLSTKCNYHHTRQCAHKCGKCKRNCPKLKNHGNGNGNGVAQRRAYALGGRDASPNSNVSTYWSTKYHGVIICDEKIVRVPFEREMLFFQGNGDNQRKESRLNMISCTKAQGYLSKGCDIFLAHVTTKGAKDKLKGKRLEDVPIVRDFLEDLP
nr:hypothetical protein [Tanacetum cinerariifolium]